MIDSKEFDTIDHCILVDKLEQLHLQNYVLQWIIEFLRDRTRCTRVGLNISMSFATNRNIMQGSGIGHGVCIVYSSHFLKPVVKITV